MKKEIFALMAIVLFLSGAGLFWESLSNLRIPQVFQKPVVLAKMSIIPLGEAKSAGSTILKAQINFDSQEIAVGGVDALLKFDPVILKIGEIILNQDLFEQLSFNREKEKEGLIKITGYLPKKLVNQVQILATLEVSRLNNQPTVLGLEFEKGKTNDSNLISWQSPKDILGEVVPLKIQ